jgi:hypothetical protein
VVIAGQRRPKAITRQRTDDLGEEIRTVELGTTSELAMLAAARLAQCKPGLKIAGERPADADFRETRTAIARAVIVAAPVARGPEAVLAGRHPAR